MKKLKDHNFLALRFLLGWTAGFCLALVFNLCPDPDSRGGAGDIAENGFGNWLAAQHAVYVDDFEKAGDFLSEINDVKSPSVLNMKNLVMFLGDGEVGNMGGNSSLFATIANATDQAKKGNWADVYKNFKSEKSQLLGLFRIWSGAATGNFTKTLDFIAKYPANDSWKNFARGAVYAATKNPKTARKYFQKVPSAFMNLGDYHLVMSFYEKHGFGKEAAALKESWVGSPGGMFMAEMDIGANWGIYDSYQKMLGAALVHNVSHNADSGFSDSSLIALRIAAILGANPDSVNYYTGGYFYSAGSPNYKKYWDKVAKNPIYEPFIGMKNAEKSELSGKTVRNLNAILRKNPLFMPVIIKLWRNEMQNGREHDALRMLNRALKHEKIPNAGRAYLLKIRAHTFYIFGEYDEAERDLEVAADLSPMDAGIMGLTARVWAAKNKNLDDAYRYAISLIKAFPAEVENWDILAMVVLRKEGEAAALEILEKVGRVAETCSELFEHLGDLRAKSGLSLAAAQAYRKAIALSEDGMVVKSEVEKKLKKVTDK